MLLKRLRCGLVASGYFLHRPHSYIMAKRQKNYSAEEDMLVARSWVAASEDPVVGTKLTGDDFRRKHFELYKQMMEDMTQDPMDEDTSCTEGSISERWNKIRKGVNLCISVKKRHPRTSGETSFDVWMKRLRPLVAEEYKKKNVPLIIIITHRLSKS